jgi:hypothetical protein
MNSEHICTSHVNSHFGCAAAQAVVTGFKPRSSHVGFVVDKAALFGFPGHSFHRLLHTHHYHHHHHHNPSLVQ